MYESRLSLHVIWLTLLALGLRLYAVGSQSLWFDEAYTVFVSRLSISEGWKYLVADGVHPPLYYWLIKLFLCIGDSEIILRMPSVVFGTLSVPALYLVGIHWLGKRGALLAALLLAISPFHIWYSQEARMYSVLAFLAVICFGLYASLLIKPNKEKKVAFIIVSSLAYLTHYFALLIPLVQFVHTSFNLKRYPRFLRSWTVMQVISAVPFLLWLIVIARRNGQFFGIGWIPQPGLLDLLFTLINFSVGYATSLTQLHWLALGVCMVLVVVGLRYVWIFPSAKSLTLMWVFLPMILIFILSQKRPTYVDRFFIFAQPAFMLLIASGISYLKRNISITISVILIIFFAWGWTNMYLGNERVKKEDWRQAGNYIAQFERPGELLVFRVLQIAIPFDFYYSGNLSTKALETNREIDPINEVTGGYDGVWLVFWNTSTNVHSMTAISSFNPIKERDPILASWIEGRGPPVIEQVDFDGVTIFHFAGLFE